MTVEEAELAIARAGGGPAPVGASASVTNGSAAGLPSAALVWRHCFLHPCLLTFDFDILKLLSPHSMSLVCCLTLFHLYGFCTPDVPLFWPCLCADSSQGSLQHISFQDQLSAACVLIWTDHVVLFM